MHLLILLLSHPAFIFLLLFAPTSSSYSSSSCPNSGPSHPPLPSVDRLRPGDIDLIGGIGDSDTAAYATRATDLTGFLFEDRDLSFISGARNPGSLFSILRRYNPGLIGGSTSRNNVLTGGDNSGLNVAVSGAVSGDARGQAMELVKKIKSFYGWRDKWKLVSIQMGSNDLCTDSCDNSKDSSPEAFRLNIEAALWILRRYLPRTLVLLMVPSDPGPLLDMTGKPFKCQIVHQFGCSCLFGQDDRAKARYRVSMLQRSYRRQMQLLAKDPKFDGQDFIPWNLSKAGQENIELIVKTASIKCFKSKSQDV